jgi:hypothetical protein
MADISTADRSNIDRSKSLGGSSKTMLLTDAVKSLPNAWRQYAEKVRPDLDPETTFANFSYYWVTGKGAGTRRSVRGWSSSWQTWVRREKAPAPGTVPPPKPKELTAEEAHEYKREVARMFGFPDKYLDAAVAGTYSAEPTNAMLQAILSTKHGRDAS